MNIQYLRMILKQILFTAKHYKIVQLSLLSFVFLGCNNFLILFHLLSFLCTY